MPITRRAFELGVDEETEALMRWVYEELATRKHEAYTQEEILQERSRQTGETVHVEKLYRALEVLVGIGALSARIVNDVDYFAFAREVDKNTWKVK